MAFYHRDPGHISAYRIRRLDEDYDSSSRLDLLDKEMKQLDRIWSSRSHLNRSNARQLERSAHNLNRTRTKQVTFSSYLPRKHHLDSERNAPTSKEIRLSVSRENKTCSMSDVKKPTIQSKSSHVHRQVFKSPIVGEISEKLDKLERQIDGFKYLQQRRNQFWAHSENLYGGAHFKEEQEKDQNLDSSSLNYHQHTTGKSLVKERNYNRAITSSTEHKYSRIRKNSEDTTEVLNASSAQTERQKLYKSRARSAYESGAVSCVGGRRENDDQFRQKLKMIRSRESMREIQNLNGDIRSKISELRNMMQVAE